MCGAQLAVGAQLCCLDFRWTMFAELFFAGPTASVKTQEEHLLGVSRGDGFLRERFGLPNCRNFDGCRCR